MSAVDGVAAGGFRDVVRHRYFRRLLIGQGVSGLGDWVGTFAFIAAAYDLTGNSTAVGAVLVLRLVPPSVAAPVGGAVADRVDRRRLMIVCDLTRAALIVLVPFVGIVLLYVIAFIHESLSMVFLAARDASVPELVEENELPEANGLVLASSFGTLPLGAALFSGLQAAAPFAASIPLVGPLFRTSDTAFAFLFDSLTFLGSAWAVIHIRLHQHRRAAHGRLLKDVWQGAWFILSHRWLRDMAAALLVAMIGGGTLFAVGIGYVRQTLDASETVFGWLAALWGAGMALGVLATRWRGRFDKSLLFVGGIVVCGGVLIAMALVPQTWLALLLSTPFGAGFSSAVVIGLSLVQHVASDEMRARLSGAVEGLFRLSLGIGAIGLGTLAQSIGGVSIGVVSLDGNQLAMITAGALIVLGGAIASRSRTAPWQEV